jgi:hypothetical protein
LSRGPDQHRPDARTADLRTSDRARGPTAGAFERGLSLPRGDERERVELRGREYFLNGPESRALATVGAFRVLNPSDVRDERAGSDDRHGVLRHLAEQGLLTRETLTDRDGGYTVVALTGEGKALLDAHASGEPGDRQEYYADIVKPRELRHDAQLYRVYLEEADRIERDGGRPTRVILDYEIKRDYQRFLNRGDASQAPDDVRRDRLAFAEAHDLPVIDGHLELPDLRIEYETEDGRIEYRDVELETEHYSRSQFAGKARAGFVRYRVGSSGRSRGGTPFDPRHLERLG